MLNPQDIICKIEDYFASVSQDDLDAAMLKTGYEYSESIDTCSIFCADNFDIEINIQYKKGNIFSLASAEMTPVEYSLLNFSIRNFDETIFCGSSDEDYSYDKAA